MSNSPNLQLRIVAQAIRAQKSRLASYAGVGTLLYGSSVGLLATSMYLLARASQRPLTVALAELIALTRIFALSRSVSRYLERLISHSIVLRSLAEFRISIFHTLVRQFPQQASELSSGKLLGRITSSIDDIQDLFLRLVGPLVLMSLTALLMLLIGLSILPVAGVLVSVLIMGYAISGAAALRGSGLSKAANERNVRELFEKTASDVMHASDELFLLGVLDDQLQLTSQLSRSMESHGMQKINRLANKSAIANAGAQFALMATLYLSIVAISHRQMAALLVAVMPMAAQAAFEAVHASVSGAALAPWYLNSVSSIPVSEVSQSKTITKRTLAPLEIRFEDVEIQRGENTRIGPKNFVVPGQSRFAILGESGSGKTSIAFAMLGYIKPLQGQIRYLRDTNASNDSGSDIGYVPENPAVLQTSLRGNLQIAADGLTDGEMTEALRAVKLEYLLSRPDGLDQHLGPTGMILSGGERQRLALARVLLASFGTVILDEPSASLDEVTGTSVLKAVLSGFQNKTVIVITHHRSLLANFDYKLELS